MADCEQFDSLHKGVADCLEAVGRFLVGLLEGPAGEDRPSQLLALDGELQKFWKTYGDLKQRHTKQNLQIAVLALTKSGKSTLLNALTSSSCLPSNNVPETARITQLIHTHLNSGEQPWLEDQGKGQIVRGQSKIQDYLRNINRAAREIRGGDEAILDLHIPFAALAEQTGTSGVSHQMTLLDTPGPNEAGEDSLKAQVDRLLDSVDVCIYLLDYTKLKTQEEADMLKKLKGINPALIKRLQSRLFFVVNKADVMYNCEGLQEEETKQYVADLITAQLQQDSFQLAPEQVLLVSAQEAHLARLMLSKQADADQQRRFHRLAFGLRATKKSEAETLDAAREFLEVSGIQQLEERVLSFLFSHSGVLKMLATVDDVNRMLHQIQNVATTFQAALKQDVEQLQAEAEKLQGELQETLAKFDGVQQQAEQVEAEVVDEVRARMQSLQERLFEKITAVLDPSEEAAPAVKTGAWKAVWNKASAFFSRQSAQGQAQQDLQRALQDLDADIQQQFESEVEDFWQGLEAATNERQRMLFHRINGHLSVLARAIESTVGELLSVRLEAVPIRMDPPSAQSFHRSLQDLLARGINSRTEEKSFEIENEEVEYVEQRTGLCGMGSHWVGRPVKRTVRVPYEETVYELNRSEIRDYYIKMVEQNVGMSVSYVRMFVQKYISQRISEARARIAEYGEKYQAAMAAALQTSRQGELHREEGLKMIAFHLASLADLQATVNSIQADASALLPVHAHDPLADSFQSAWTEAELPPPIPVQPSTDVPQPSRDVAQPNSDLTQQTAAVQPPADNLVHDVTYPDPIPTDTLEQPVLSGGAEQPIATSEDGAKLPAADSEPSGPSRSTNRTVRLLEEAFLSGIGTRPDGPAVIPTHFNAAEPQQVSDPLSQSDLSHPPPASASQPAAVPSGPSTAPAAPHDLAHGSSSGKDVHETPAASRDVPIVSQAQMGSSTVPGDVGHLEPGSHGTSPAEIHAGEEEPVHQLHHPLSSSSSAASSCSSQGSADWELVSDDEHDHDDHDSHHFDPIPPTPEPLTLRR